MALAGDHNAAHPVTSLPKRVGRGRLINRAGLADRRGQTGGNIGDGEPLNSVARHIGDAAGIVETHVVTGPKGAVAKMGDHQSLVHFVQEAAGAAAVASVWNENGARG